MFVRSSDLCNLQPGVLTIVKPFATNGERIPVVRTFGSPKLEGDR